MSRIPKPHEIYRHFKGNLYQILAVAEHSETSEQLVIYQALYGEFKIYARPLENFLEKVDTNKYPDVKQTFRFELQVFQAEKAEKSESSLETPQTVRTNQTEIDTECSPESKKESCKESNKECSNEGNKESYIENNERNEDNIEKEDSEEIVNIDPMVMQFLDADTYEERLNILVGIRHRITDEMITTMAIACDVEVPQGDLEERFTGLKNCLVTLDKFECTRLR